MTNELIAAAKTGDTQALSKLIAEGADVNGADDFGTSPLIAAAMADELDCVRELVRAGAEVLHLDAAGSTAGGYGSHELADAINEVLVEMRGESYAKDVALLGAVDDDDEDGVQAALADGANPNAQNLDGDTALTWASVEAGLEIVEALLDGGADIDAEDIHGYTPLLLACRGTHDGAAKAKLLIERGADVNLAGPNGVTALMFAADTPYIPLLSHLVEAGADLHATDKRRRNALAFAKKAKATQRLLALGLKG